MITSPREAADQANGSPLMSRIQDDLVERIASQLANRDVRKVRMFGGVSFIVDNKMVVAAGRDGRLLVRINPMWYPRLIEEPGAEPATMGANRPMGESWITVSAGHLGTTDQLQSWVGRGLDHCPAG
jgi:TfoX/Sxy family transcriptional regulator of competence genes